MNKIYTLLLMALALSLLVFWTSKEKKKEAVLYYFTMLPYIHYLHANL